MLFLAVLFQDSMSAVLNSIQYHLVTAFLGFFNFPFAGIAQFAVSHLLSCCEGGRQIPWTVLALVVMSIICWSQRRRHPTGKHRKPIYAGQLRLEMSLLRQSLLGISCGVIVSQLDASLGLHARHEHGLIAVLHTVSGVVGVFIVAYILGWWSSAQVFYRVPSVS